MFGDEKVMETQMMVVHRKGMKRRQASWASEELPMAGNEQGWNYVTRGGEDRGTTHIVTGRDHGVSAANSAREGRLEGL